jgi:hypothetical protein
MPNIGYYNCHPECSVGVDRISITHYVLSNTTLAMVFSDLDNASKLYSLHAILLNAEITVLVLDASAVSIISLALK